MDDFNGREASQAPSSSSDFYNDDSPDKQHDGPAQPSCEDVNLDGPATNGIAEDDDPDDDDDSSSEMDTSGSSRSASPGLEPRPESSREPPQDVALQTIPKRKLSDADDGTDQSSQAVQDSSKRRRLSTEASMPLAGHPELWQRVFLFLPHAMLGRCLSVCRTFNDCLTNARAAPAVTKAQSRNQPIARAIDCQSIWTSSRKAFLSSFPRPLARFDGPINELRMFQLISGKTCQFCNRLAESPPATTPFNRGPGSDGVRVFWPFGVRACGSCIEKHTVKVCIGVLMKACFCYV